MTIVVYLKNQKRKETGNDTTIVVVVVVVVYFKNQKRKETGKDTLSLMFILMKPEKKKRLEEMASRVKKTTAHRKMAKDVNTATREALHAEKGESETMLVTRKGDPRAAAGGGVMRISKKKYDPTIHNRASE